MAELTRKEFASLCHTTAAIISTNIGRDKITEVDKIIDTTNAKNKKFFNKYFKLHEEKKAKANKAVDVEKLYEATVEKIEKVKKVSKAERELNARLKEQNEKDSESEDWDLRKKKAETLLKERQADKEQMQLQKLAGQLIPVDLTMTILKVHNVDIFSTFQNDIENLASVFCDKLAGGDRKKLAEINQKISEMLDRTIKKSKELAEASLRALIEEYSVTRNRGERK